MMVLKYSVFRNPHAALLASKASERTLTEDTPVCCSDTGGRYCIDNFTHWWGKWRKANGFENLKFHELRRTQATLLLANGVDVKTVQERMGHASAQVTLDWYAHAVPENDRKAADMFGQLLEDKNTNVVEMKSA